MSTGSVINKAEAFAIIAESFNEDVSNIAEGVPREQLEGWDSMGILLLMAEFDEKFNITIPEDRLEKLLTIDDILQLLADANVLAG